MSFTEVLLPSPLPRSYTRRSVGVLAGLGIIGFGDAFIVGAHLGTSPFGTVIVAISNRVGWTVGDTVILVGLLMVAIATAVTRRLPGKVALLAPIICGTVDNLVLPHAQSTGIARWFFGLAGMLIMGVGVGVYVGAGLGRAAIESIVDRIGEVTGRPMSQIMVGWQLVSLLLAVALGGKVGPLTVLFPLVIPAVAGYVLDHSPWLPANAKRVERQEKLPAFLADRTVAP